MVNLSDFQDVEPVELPFLHPCLDMFFCVLHSCPTFLGPVLPCAEVVDKTNTLLLGERGGTMPNSPQKMAKIPWSNPENKPALHVYDIYIYNYI